MIELSKTGTGVKSLVSQSFIPHSRPTLDEEEEKAVRAVIKSGLVAYGDKVAEFEAALAKHVVARGAACVNSGTTAIQLLLEARGIRGKEVAMPSYCCPAPAYAVLRSGNTPRFVDCDEYGNLSPESLAPLIRKNTAAVIAVHNNGTPARLREIKKLCSEEGLFLIEDCAQAIGAEYDGKRVGAFGDASVFSFYATKIICTGEGGAVASNDEELVERVRETRSCDWKRADAMRKGSFSVRESDVLKANYKMTDLQAAMGIEQLKKLGSFIAARRRLAGEYAAGFAELEKKGIVELPREPADAKSVFHHYVLHLTGKKSAESVVAKLLRGGVGASVLFPAIHELAFFKKFVLPGQRFEKTERLTRASVSLPLYPSLSDDEFERVVEAVSNAFE